MVQDFIPSILLLFLIELKDSIIIQGFILTVLRGSMLSYPSLPELKFPVSIH